MYSSSSKSPPIYCSLRLPNAEPSVVRTTSLRLTAPKRPPWITLSSMVATPVESGIFPIEVKNHNGFTASHNRQHRSFLPRITSSSPDIIQDVVQSFRTTTVQSKNRGSLYLSMTDSWQRIVSLPWYQQGPTETGDRSAFRGRILVETNIHTSNIPFRL